MLTSFVEPHCATCQAALHTSTRRTPHANSRLLRSMDGNSTLQKPRLPLYNFAQIDSDVSRRLGLLSVRSCPIAQRQSHMPHCHACTDARSMRKPARARFGLNKRTSTYQTNDGHNCGKYAKIYSEFALSKQHSLSGLAVALAQAKHQYRAQQESHLSRYARQTCLPH